MNPDEAVRQGALLALVQHQQRVANAFVDLAQRIRARRRRKRFQVRQWIARRPQLGIYEQLMVELRREDPAAFTNMVRMPPDMFDEILVRLRPRLERDHVSRATLDPGRLHKAILLSRLSILFKAIISIISLHVCNISYYIKYVVCYLLQGSRWQ